MTNVNEAIGVTRAAMACGIPVVISFTLETDGRLPTGESLQEAIEAVVSVIDRTTNTVVGLPIPVGDNPVGVAITPDGKRAYVANAD